MTEDLTKKDILEIPANQKIELPIDGSQIPLNSIPNQAVQDNALQGPKFVDNFIVPTGKDFRSADFSAGASGWIIYGNGSVEFNNGTFRGTLTAASINIPDATTANSFHVDTAGLVWLGANVANKATAPVRINPTGEMTLGDPTAVHIQLSGPNVRMQSSDYSAGVTGFYISATLIEAENLVARGIMRGSTFQYDLISAIGGQIIVANSDVLASDMTALDASTLTTRGTTTWAVNDIIVARSVTALGTQEEWLRITNIGSAPTYTVTRDLAGSFAANTNPIWKAGTTIVKQGSSDGASAYSGGWLRLFGEGTNAPYYSVFSRTGVAYNSYTERVRMGNLNGFLDYASAIFGIAGGDSDANFKIDPTNGVLISGGLNNINQFTANEAIAVGKAVYILSSNGRSAKTDSTDYTKAEGYVGFAKTSAAGAASTHYVQSSGKVTGFSGLTAGRNYYLAKIGTTDSNISQTNSESDYQTFNGGAFIKAWQFTISNPAKISSIIVRALREGTPGDIRFALRKGTATGNAPAGAEPTVWTSDYAYTTFGTVAAEYTLDLDELSLTADTYYLVAWVPSGTHDAGNRYIFYGGSGAGTIDSYTATGAAWDSFNNAAYLKVNYIDNGVTYATGDITDYFFAYPKIAGIAVSATELFILGSDGKVSNGTITISAVGVTTVTLGYRPKKITVFANFNATSSQGSQTALGIATTISTGAASSVSTTLLWSLSAGSGGTAIITDTGFMLVCSTFTATSHLAWTAEG